MKGFALQIDDGAMGAVIDDFSTAPKEKEVLYGPGVAFQVQVVCYLHPDGKMTLDTPKGAESPSCNRFSVRHHLLACLKAVGGDLMRGSRACMYVSGVKGLSRSGRE